MNHMLLYEMLLCFFNGVRSNDMKVMQQVSCKTDNAKFAFS